MAELAKEPTSTPEEQAFWEIIGDLVEQWGFKRHLGRIWSLLYLRQKPLNATDIQMELGLSAGNVNGLLAELLTWGVVRKVYVSNDRNIYYDVERQIWKSITNVVRARELRILEEAITRLKSLDQRLVGAGNSEPAYQKTQVAHVTEIIETFFSIARLLVEASPRSLSVAGKLVGRLRQF